MKYEYFTWSFIYFFPIDLTVQFIMVDISYLHYVHMNTQYVVFLCLSLCSRVCFNDEYHCYVSGMCNPGILHVFNQCVNYDFKMWQKEGH